MRCWGFYFNPYSSYGRFGRAHAKMKGFQFGKQVFAYLLDGLHGCVERHEFIKNEGLGRLLGVVCPQHHGVLMDAAHVTEYAHPRNPLALDRSASDFSR